MRKGTLPYRHGSLMTPIAVVLCYFVVLSLMLLGFIQLAEANADGETAAGRPPASAFYRLPQYAYPQISPSGHYLASRITTNGKLGLLVNPISINAEPFLMDSGDRWDLRNSLWVSDHELLVSFSRPQTNGRTRFLIRPTARLMP